MKKRLIVACLLAGLLAPLGMASEPSMAFRTRIIQGQIVLTPMRPIMLTARKIEGPALAPDDIVSCALSATVDGILLRCGQTRLVVSGLAVEAE